MHILLLSPYPPYPPRSGGALRIYHLLRGLAARHEVTLLTFAPDAAAVAALAPLRAICGVISVPGPPRRSLLRRGVTTLTAATPDMGLRNQAPAYAEALSRLLAARRYDVVQAESIEMAGYLMQARGLGPLLALDEFNAEYVLQRRAAQALADGEAVELVGEVADVRPYIDGAAVFVLPMRIGGGSRLKLLEALAMEAPVVSTSLGVEGIAGLRHETHLLIADRAETFAAAVLRLIADPDLGARLGAAGRAHVAAHYDWKVIVPRLEAAYC